jgi:hypothetical protein
MSNNNYFNSFNLNDASTVCTTSVANTITTPAINELSPSNNLLDQQYNEYNHHRINLLYHNHNSKVLNTNPNAVNYNHPCHTHDNGNYMMNMNSIAATAAAVAAASTASHQNLAYHQPMFANTPNSAIDSTQNLQNSASQMQNLIYPWMRNTGGKYSFVSHYG